MAKNFPSKPKKKQQQEIFEYLYIEEYPFDPKYRPKKEEKEDCESDRGVIIIEIL